MTWTRWRRLAAPASPRRQGTTAPPPSASTTRRSTIARRWKWARRRACEPLLELWGTHPDSGPSRHGIYVTVAAGRADASLLLDVFHLYKSGTPFTALKQINGASLHVIHLNDYPQAADASTLNDGNRIYPGDYAAPLRQILRDLRDNGFRGHLSLELFNRLPTGPAPPTRT